MKQRTTPASLFLTTATTLACLATAHAQSSVQVYGTLDIAVGSFKDAGGQRSTQVASGNMTTSYVGFKGSEDLGNGLQAQFTLESYLRNDEGAAGRYNGDNFWSRAANVALSGGFGTVKLGRIGTPLFTNVLRHNPFGASFSFSPAIRTHFSYTGKVSGDTAWNNAVEYATPNLGGFTGHVLVGAKEQSQGDNLSASLRYANQALSVGLVVQKVEVPFTRGSETTWQLGASYDLASVKLFGQYGRVRETQTPLVSANTTDRIAQLGLSVPVGNGAILASWGQARTTEAVQATRTFTSLGYDHRLSKRTDLYAVLMGDRWTSRENGGSVGFGIRHAF
jgi:predicted porin